MRYEKKVYFTMLSLNRKSWVNSPILRFSLSPIRPFAHSSIRMAWVLAAGCCLLTTGSVSAKPLSAQEIVKRAADEYDRVQDYMVDAKVTVSSPDVHVPEMNVKIYFKKPDKLHVESKSGFAVLPKQGLVAGNPLRNLSLIHI